MITDDNKLPKVTHKPKTGIERTEAHDMIDKFALSMKDLFDRKMTEGKTGWDDPTNLLGMRRALVENVKEGMLERKNKEVEIGLLAAMVCHIRLKGAGYSPPVAEVAPDRPEPTEPDDAPDAGNEEEFDEIAPEEVPDESDEEVKSGYYVPEDD